MSSELTEQPHGRALTNERGREVGPALDRILTTPPASGGMPRSPQRIVCTGFSSIGLLTDKSATLAQASNLNSDASGNLHLAVTPLNIAAVARNGA
jgi:hypothetical protein